MATEDDQNEWKDTWDAREAALKAVLGEPDETHGHALIPFYLGGQADVLYFRKHIPGRVAATCELLGESAQKRSKLGTYELMIVHRDDNDWGAGVISHLARYTCDAVLQPGDTMDITAGVPKKSTIAGFLCVDYSRFKFRGENAGLLLCLGITADEMAACRRGKRDEVLDALKAAGVYPYTDLFRATVLKSGGKGFWRRILGGGE